MNRKLTAILLSLTICALLIPSAGCDVRVTGDGFSDVLIGVDVDPGTLRFLDRVDDDDDDFFHDLDFDDDDGFFDDDDGLFDDDDDDFF